MTLVIAIIAFLVFWGLTLDVGALGEFALLLGLGWLIIRLTCKCKKEERLDALKIYTLLMLCYGAYAFLCHAYRVYNGWDAIGSIDGSGYYLPCTMELFDAQSLWELIIRTNERGRYHTGGTIFIYFVAIAKLARNYLNTDLHLAIQLSMMPFAALTCVVEYHLLRCFNISSSEAYKWSIGFGLFSALFWLSSFIVRDLPIVLAYFLISYLIFLPARRWQLVLLISGAATLIVCSIRLASGIGMIPLLLLAVFCDPNKGTIKYWQLGLCIVIAILMGGAQLALDEFSRISHTYLEIELRDQGGDSLLSSLNVLPFGVSHVAKILYAQFHPVPAWRNMVAAAAHGYQNYAYNITKFPDIWVVFFRITGVAVLFYGCLKSEIRRKIFENKPLLYSFIYILLWMMMQASTIEERRKVGGYAILFTVAVLCWREMTPVSRKRILLVSLAMFISVQLVFLLRLVL